MAVSAGNDPHVDSETMTTMTSSSTASYPYDSSALPTSAMLYGEVVSRSSTNVKTKPVGY